MPHLFQDLRVGVQETRQDTEVWGSGLRLRQEWGQVCVYGFSGARR